MKKNNLTVKFTLIQVFYWSAFCGIFSYAVAFLLSKGFSASQAGIILFMSNFLSFILQPSIASRADKAKKNVLVKYIITLCLISISCIAAMMIPNLSKTAVAVFFFVGAAFFDMEQPFLNSIIIVYENNGWHTNYGIGRGLGALGYGISSVILGYVIEDVGTGIIPKASIGLSLLFILLVATYPKIPDYKTEQRTQETSSLVEFTVKYKWYVLSLIGLLLLCMAHVMMENYLIEIFTNLGGGSSNIGIALLVATLTETVVLVFIARIVRFAGMKKLLIIGGFSYILKIILFIIAKQIWVIYVAQILQLCSYTFICPTQWYFARDCVNDADMVKGQSMSTASWAIGGAFGNLLGGVLISAYGLKSMLASVLVITILGTAVFILTVPRAISASGKN